MNKLIAWFRKLGKVEQAEPQAPAQVKVLARLTADEYEKLVRQLPGTVVTSQTTDTQAAFQLGCAHVVKLLRDGWVIA